MKLIILLLISSVCFGQAKDTVKQKSINANLQQATDSTALLSIRDIQTLAKYLEDKMLAKDYNLVINAIGQLIEARVKEYAVKPKSK